LWFVDDEGAAAVEAEMKLIQERFTVIDGVGALVFGTEARLADRLAEKREEGRGSLYLFCTWTPAFSRISPIERFGVSKLFANLRIRAERLPPPPPTIVEFIPEFARFHLPFPPPPRFLHAGNFNIARLS
jgi:hypothetical protein